MLWTGITCLILCFIAFEDFTSRSVNVFSLMALASLIVYKSLKGQPASLWAAYVGVNFAYIFMIFGLCALYIYWRYDKWQFTSFIGSGDIVFILIVGLLLNPLIFFLFNTVTSIVALVSHVVLIRISNKYERMKTIPLAGFQSACLIVFIFSTTPIGGLL